MGELTIRSSLHVTKSTGDTILGYPFLTRFEPLINWKERYMEIQHQNQTFRIFGITARGSVYEHTTNHSKNTSSSFIDTIQISTQISNIHTRLEQLQTSIAKLTPISIPHSTTSTSNNYYTTSRTTNTKPPQPLQNNNNITETTNTKTSQNISSKSKNKKNKSKPSPLQTPVTDISVGVCM